jgi:ABC-type nitrate/sulfonate/bicarbonate transport system substrate-binding protein
MLLIAGLLALAACGGDGGDGGESGDAANPAEGIRVGYAGGLDPNDIADQWAIDEVGGEVEELAEDSGVVAAIMRGDLDVGSIDYVAAMLAREAGADISIFYVTQTTPEFIMVASSDIEDFDDLAGKRIAYHCPGCTDEAFLRTLVKQNAPEAYPEVEWLVLEESPVRAQAMLAGRFEATDLEALSLAHVFKEAPGDFHSLGAWSDLEGDAKSVVATVWVAKTEDLANDREKYQAFAEELQTGYDRFYEDKDGWVDLASEKLPDVDASLLPGTYDVYEEVGMYPKTGTAPLTPEQFDIIDAFYQDVGEFEESLSDEIIDWDMINEVSGG